MELFDGAVGDPGLLTLEQKLWLAGQHIENKKATIKEAIRDEYRVFSTENNLTVVRRGKVVPRLLCSRTLNRYVQKIQELARLRLQTHL